MYLPLPFFTQLLSAPKPKHMKLPRSLRKANMATNNHQSPSYPDSILSRSLFLYTSCFTRYHLSSVICFPEANSSTPLLTDGRNTERFRGSSRTELRPTNHSNFRCWGESGENAARVEALLAGCKTQMIIFGGGAVDGVRK